MDKQQTITQMNRLTKRTYWLGVGLGFLLGLIVGFVVGASMNSGTNVVIPVSEGVKV